MMNKIQDHIDTERPINMGRYLNFFTIDVFSTLMFNESWESLSRGDDVVLAETPDGTIYETPFIRTVHDPVILNTALGMEPSLLSWTKPFFSWHPYAKTGKHFENIIAHAARKRLTSDTDIQDIMSKLLANNKGEPTGLTKPEILAEASVMMNAGTDTTTAALTYTVFLLYKHTDILARLREEIDAATMTTMDDTELISYDTASRLPFLRACIEESLRLRPPSSFGLPRIVPKGGRMIAGQFIPEGVTVSVPTYSMLRNQEAFDNPDTYNPDRWITGDKEKMAKAHFPFSMGPRACIGRNIAYYEQLMVVANLVKMFDFEFVQGKGFELRTIERFNSNPDEMVLRCYRRVKA
jgi:benzoate 4-monooxygenase